MKEKPVSLEQQLEGQIGRLGARREGAASSATPARESTATEATSSPMPNFVAANGAAVRVMLEAGQAIVMSAAAFNAELMSFGRQRLHAQFENAGSLAAWEGLWDKAARHQAEFQKCMVQDYFAEASKLLDLTSKTSEEISTPAEHAAEAIFHSLEQRSA